MPLLDLSEVGDDLSAYLAFFIEQAQAATDAPEIASAAMTTSAYYEALGLTELLLDANVSAFEHHLIRSGQSRLWLLDKVEHSAETARATKASYLRPFVDALAARQLELARQIAYQETDEWVDRHEYEDDFCYAKALHHIVRGDGADIILPLLDRYEEILSGADEPRIDLCRALLNADQDGAEDAFLKLIDQHTERIETVKQNSAYWDGSDALLYPNVFVFAEGLAWLTLLDNAGIPMDDEYRYCPAVARSFTPTPFLPDAFPFRPL